MVAGGSVAIFVFGLKPSCLAADNERVGASPKDFKSTTTSMEKG
jgi:hypothetical protein